MWCTGTGARSEMLHEAFLLCASFRAPVSWGEGLKDKTCQGYALLGSTWIARRSWGRGCILPAPYSMCFLSTYACVLASIFLISLSRLYSVSFHIFYCRFVPISRSCFVFSCSRTRYAGISLASPMNLQLFCCCFWAFSLTTVVSLWPQNYSSSTSTNLSRIRNQDGHWV